MRPSCSAGSIAAAAQGGRTALKNRQKLAGQVRRTADAGNDGFFREYASYGKRKPLWRGMDSTKKAVGDLAETIDERYN
jgi:hypothetical protein